MTDDVAILPRERHGAYAAHLKRLDQNDRRMRFWVPVGDAAIEAHVARIPEEAAVFAIMDGDLVAGALEIIPSITKDGRIDAEFALSVDHDHRGLGMAHRLVEAAVAWAMAKRVADLFALCLTSNAQMIGLARAHAMRVDFDGQEAHAHLRLAA
jgi:GNAT superfamily N-acetyltransferase